MRKFSLCLSILAATTAALATSALAAPAAPLDAAKVEAFVDREIHELLRRSWVPGATVAVVQGERILLVEGYGVANIATGERVDPQRSLFRVGSITKVMTTAAALRLAEQGKLDLDRDVNRYLRSVKIAPTFPQPVTARHLMTHRGGFDSSLVGLMMTKDADTILSKEARQRAFVRARPVTAPFYYDNLGYGLLGTMVADISKTTYRKAIRDLVFDPLEMPTAVAGLPAEREADAAGCHRPDAQGSPSLCEQGLIADAIQGGGDASVSAADMARFMRALLVPGLLLQPQTLERMKDTDGQRLHPLLPGLGLTLREADYAGRRTIGHHGSINGFVSEFALFPQLELGIFISVNGEEAPSGPRVASTVLGEGMATGAIDARPLVQEFVGKFAVEFVPSTQVTMTAAAALAKKEIPAAQLAGVYSRPDETIAATPGATTNSPTRVTLTADGNLDAYGCAPFVRKAPMYYECAPAVGYPLKLAFSRDESGRILLGHIAIEALVRQAEQAEGS